MTDEYIGWLDDDWNTVLDQSQSIVRCRDCKHYRDRNGAILPSKVCQRLGYYNFKVEPGGFCAWGERNVGE